MLNELMGLRNVSKTFGGVAALRDVSLSLRRGEIHCIAGQNGSGKSTLIKVMSGVHRPNSGAIAIDGKEVSTWTPRDAIEAGIQVIYQDFSLFGNLTVAENLALSTQCGFASIAAGNLLSMDEQWRKLELVVDTARKVWG